MECKHAAEILSQLKRQGSLINIPRDLLTLLEFLKLSHCDRYTIMWEEKKKIEEECLTILCRMKMQDAQINSEIFDLLLHFGIKHDHI